MALSTLTGCFGRQPMGGTQAAYRQVDAEEARELMDTEGDYAIVDARTQSEYDEGHIPGAVLIPHDSVAQLAEDELPDKDQLILAYCRSGNRSKQAAGAWRSSATPTWWSSAASTAGPTRSSGRGHTRQRRYESFRVVAFVRCRVSPMTSLVDSASQPK